MHRHRALAAEIAVDAVLQSMTESGRSGPTFSAIRDGGVLTTWQHSEGIQLEQDFGGRVPDPIGSAFWMELQRLGESIQAEGGLDALDEANMHIVQMDPRDSDWRAMVLESVWFDIGRGS